MSIVVNNTDPSHAGIIVKLPVRRSRLDPVSELDVEVAPDTKVLVVSSFGSLLRVLY
jgi:hypothetical protein